MAAIAGRRRAMAVAAAVAAIGCRGGDRPTPPGAPPDASASPAHALASAPPEPRSPAPAPPAIAEAAVRGLVDAWARAQADGDAKALSALYADGCTGVDRTGGRLARYSRAAWFAARPRIAPAAARRAVDGLRVTAGAVAAVADFAWRGPVDAVRVRLVAARRGDGLAIVREELGPADVAGDGAAPVPADVFSFVVTDGGVPYVVVDRTAPRDWAAGPPVLVSRAPARALSAARLDALPAPLRAWRGKAVALFRPAGAPCTGHVDGLYVLSGFEPPAEAENAWSTMEDAAVAADIVRTAPVHWLVARAPEACAGALWARADDKNLIPRAVRLPEGDRPDVEAAATEHFRKLAGYRARQRAYRRAGRRHPWDAAAGGPLVVVFDDPKVGRTFAAVTVRPGRECGGWTGSLWALFQLVDGGRRPRLVALTDPREPGPAFVPQTLADVDRDGDFEVIGHGALAKLVGRTYRTVDRAALPALDSPCAAASVTR
ncbi:MAG: hypothetical protein D6689_14610 [Deltaproteobacteria bacterium]|nr:MAG: hypothetical protein D6689_14610 [Deltaproteobacteria bacterium]